MTTYSWRFQQNSSVRTYNWITEHAWACVCVYQMAQNITSFKFSCEDFSPVFTILFFLHFKNYAFPHSNQVPSVDYRLPTSMNRILKNSQNFNFFVMLNHIGYEHFLHNIAINSARKCINVHNNSICGWKCWNFFVELWFFELWITIEQNFNFLISNSNSEHITKLTGFRSISKCWNEHWMNEKLVCWIGSMEWLCVVCCVVLVLGLHKEILFFFPLELCYVFHESWSRICIFRVVSWLANIHNTQYLMIMVHKIDCSIPNRQMHSHIATQPHTNTDGKEDKLYISLWAVNQAQTLEIIH